VEMSGENILLYGSFAAALFLGFIVAGGTCLALGLYWEIMRGEAFPQKIVWHALLFGGATWLGFFALVVAPEAWSLWREFFTKHDLLASFFDISSALTGCGAAVWVGLRLKREFVRKNTLEPGLFTTRWGKMGPREHLRILWQGGGLGLLSAVIANFFFAVSLTVFWMSRGSAFAEILSTIGFLGLWGIMFSGIPAIVAGYALAYVIQQDVLNENATKNNSLLQGAVAGGLSAFGVCVIFGGLYLTNPRMGSITPDTPYIFLATLLASLAGGLAGGQLFKRMQGQAV